ncbi:YHYH domain-containing protein [Erwinia sp. V71]|uniref:YHYH domain-containing protein n=1 Tax=Erwinia sp. V71 TaxID=3369424 RepID=UPI003F64811D
MRKIASMLLVLLAFSVAPPSFAHSGGTDSSGCHTNHKTGDYHCHNRNNIEQ